MGDFCEDSEDGRSSFGDEERVRRIFQACDINGDGFIDSQDLLNVCRELSLEYSLDDLLKELGADENGRICYEEFVRRRLALKPEIEAMKLSHHKNLNTQTEYLPTSSENSLGEGKMSWEFDSGARDLSSPEPHTHLQQTHHHPASGNLLELANKLHVAAVASLKSEIDQLSRRLSSEREARLEAEQMARSEREERRRLETHVAELSNSHEEQLTELHSVIAELTRKLHLQRSFVIHEEEPSEADEHEGSAGGASEHVECSRTLPAGEEEEEEEEEEDQDDFDQEEEEEEEGIEINTLRNDKRNLVRDTTEAEYNQDAKLSQLRKELEQSQADNGLLQQRLTRALQDLEVISNLNSKKKSESSPTLVDVVRTARVAAPNALLDRTSPSLIGCLERMRTPSPAAAAIDNFPPVKLAERVYLKNIPLVDEDGSAGSSFPNQGGVPHGVSDDCCDTVNNTTKCIINNDQSSVIVLNSELERCSSRLEKVRAQNAVLAITLEECKAHCDRLTLLVGKYESNAVALQLALSCADEALECAEALYRLAEAELNLLLAGGRSEDEHRKLKWTMSENRKQTEELRGRLQQLKKERDLCRGTVVQLESVHSELPLIPTPSSAVDASKLDLETAVLMQELMNMREERVNLKWRIHQLEKQRSLGDLAARSTAETTDPLKELRHQATLVLDLRAANAALVAAMERTKRKYQTRLRRSEVQIAQLLEQQQAQVKSLKQRIALLEETSHLNARLEETNI